MFNKPFYWLLLLVLVLSCGRQEVVESPGFVDVDGQRFVDPEGRQLILNGINFISKNPAEGYMPPQGEAVFQQFRSWGFNCIRLGIIWDGLEPEPGKYNEAYLEEIDQRIEWARENNIYVMLDMHQDLYGSKYSDGAPEWATLDEGKPHYTGAVWSDSYLISPAVQTAFDNFWKNTPASDGIGVQDHYVNLWKKLAERYADNTTVIGYDIMNEPFMGSEAQQVMPLMLEAYARVYVEKTGQAPPSGEELTAMWGDEDKRLEALELISGQQDYSKVVDAVYELNADFEKNELQSMYQKVANAIREVDPNHILFFNHSYFVNTGVSTALEPTKLADGSVDKRVAYAAHGYDLVVDTKAVENPSYERVEFIFDRIDQSGKRMNVPVIVGEWGALHGKSDGITEAAKHLIDLFEGHQFSNTYWAYYQDIETYPYFNEAIIRPFPASISGTLVATDYNFQTGEYLCEWKENGENTDPTIIYVPQLKNLSEKEIKISPDADQIIFEYCENSSAGRLIIAPSGNETIRRLQFTLPLKDEIEIAIK